MLPTQYISMGLALATAAVFGVWQMERAKTARLEGQLTGEKQVTEVLRAANESAERNTQMVREIAGMQTREVQNLRRDLNDVDNKLIQVTEENMRLRTQRKEKAMQDTFGAGVDSADDLNTSLCIAAGKSEDCHSTPRSP